MSDWISAAGIPQASTSNLMPEEQRGKINTTVGGSHLETRKDVNGGTQIVSNGSAVYQASNDLSYQGSVVGSAKTEGGTMIVGRAIYVSEQATLLNVATTDANAAVYAEFLVRNSDGIFF